MITTSTKKNSWIVYIALVVFINLFFCSSFAHSQADSTYLRFLKPRAQKNTFKSSLHLVMPPIRPTIISTSKVVVARPDDKLLSNVLVYPNPITDQINLKYEISRNTLVSIKILDVLGNEVITIFSQRVEPGEKTYTYLLNNKLPRGFYFIRIIAGTESVIKRISVL
jgi:hypothetical protein